MIIENKDHITLLIQENETINELISKIEEGYSKFKNDNLIVHISMLSNFSLDQAVEFLKISKDHRAKKQSFVIVNENFNSNESPDELIIVPTVQEAFDVIEMEDIERDLEF